MRPTDIGVLSRLTPRTLRTETGTPVAVPAGLPLQVSSFSGASSLIPAAMLSPDTWLHVSSISLSLNNAAGGIVLEAMSSGISVLPSANLIHGLDSQSFWSLPNGGNVVTLGSGAGPFMTRALDAWLKMEEFLQQGPATGIFHAATAYCYNVTGAPINSSLIAQITYDVWREGLIAGVPKD